MSGASRPHNTIVLNVGSDIHQQLKNHSCRAYANDIRVKADPMDLHTYSDVVVVCGKEQFDDVHFDTLLNPALIIEVLLDYTEAYDRARKFEYYKLESLKYVC